MVGTLHDGLCARELYVGLKALSHVEVQTANKQEPKLRLTQLLVEVRIPASRNIDLERIV
jgi:hypothetical protein